MVSVHYSYTTPRPMVSFAINSSNCKLTLRGGNLLPDCFNTRTSPSESDYSPLTSSSTWQISFDLSRVLPFLVSRLSCYRALCCVIELLQTLAKWPFLPQVQQALSLYLHSATLCLGAPQQKQQTTFGFLNCFPLIWLTGSCLLTVCDPAVSRSHLGGLISLKFFSASSTPWAISKALLYVKPASNNNFFCILSSLILLTSLAGIIFSKLSPYSQNSASHLNSSHRFH